MCPGREEKTYVINLVKEKPPIPPPKMMEKLKGIWVPPVILWMLRAYAIIFFIGVLAKLKFLPLQWAIFGILAVVTSMLFVVGYLLISGTARLQWKPIWDIVHIVLFFVKGFLLIFFIWVARSLNMLPEFIAWIFVTAVATALVTISSAVYVFDTFRRTYHPYRKKNNEK